jgi:hypothetical protein
MIEPPNFDRCAAMLLEAEYASEEDRSAKLSAALQLMYEAGKTDAAQAIGWLIRPRTDMGRL